MIRNYLFFCGDHLSEFQKTQSNCKYETAGQMMKNTGVPCGMHPI